MTTRRSGRPAGRAGEGGDALASLRLVTAALADRKAIDPTVLDLRGLTAAADEGRSDRPPNTHIVASIDQAKFLERLGSCFAGKEPGT